MPQHDDIYSRFSGQGDASVEAVDLGNWEPTGFPSIARDYMDDAIDLNRLLAPNRASTFVVRAGGNGLRHCGIFDGDLLIIDRSLTPRHGDCIAVYADGEFRIVVHDSRLPAADSGMLFWGVVSHNIHSPSSSRQ
ncbi:MAG: hypothetical protein HUK13_09625 [Muribaculaceae bacterium]|nr:hypothetical protein [Muribaculaceae bacterium]